LVLGKDHINLAMKKYHIWTIGCQMNKVESVRLSSCFERSGFQYTDRAEEANVIIINSCVVRQSAENKVINKLANLKALKKVHPDTTLAVTGCLVDSDNTKLKERFPQVDYFFQPGHLPPWLEKSITPDILLPERPAISSYVSIIQGCNNFCSYCIVPYRRGREISRQIDDIVCEVNELVLRGVKEVILLGQNVDSYGHDLTGKPDLADLLIELDKISNLARIRFLTNHPKDMSPKLINTMANSAKICEQLSLPVQAGDDHILKLMKRGYTADHFHNLITLIREKIPAIALSTDVIVGFPTETTEQFQNTYDLIANIKFDNVHIAAYSPREGTFAAREMDDDVSAEEKTLRVEMIEKLQEKIATELNAKLYGKVIEILVEGKKSGKWWGRTRTDKLVFFSSEADCYGKLVDIKIEKTSPWSLIGKLWN
jgi:tRNA-2-methylthio-N6-dimethylallyladenosine synthase